MMAGADIHVLRHVATTCILSGASWHASGLANHWWYLFFILALSLISIYSLCKVHLKQTCVYIQPYCKGGDIYM